jgi:hypothetical protein
MLYKLAHSLHLTAAPLAANSAADGDGQHKRDSATPNSSKQVAVMVDVVVVVTLLLLLQLQPSSRSGMHAMKKPTEMMGKKQQYVTFADVLGSVTSIPNQRNHRVITAIKNW